MAPKKITAETLRKAVTPSKEAPEIRSSDDDNSDEERPTRGLQLDLA